MKHVQNTERKIKYMSFLQFQKMNRNYLHILMQFHSAI